MNTVLRSIKSWTIGVFTSWVGGIPCLGQIICKIDNCNNAADVRQRFSNGFYY